MPNKGKGNKEVVQSLINDIRSFNDFVSNELDNMLRKTDHLGNSWKDNQYGQFNNFMNELDTSLRKDLVSLEETADKLQEKVNMYE